jgi:IMP dehydrogenase
VRGDYGSRRCGVSGEAAGETSGRAREGAPGDNPAGAEWPAEGLPDSILSAPPRSHPGGAVRLVRDVMSHKILYVTREATVRTAVGLLRAHGADVVPVMDGGRVVGLLDALSLTLFDGEASVEEAFHEPLAFVETDTPLADASRLMRQHRLRQVPVLHDGQLVGLLSVRDLLRVWGVVPDNLTGLPVQHQLRDWIYRYLATGTEVVVLFLDLNDFGMLNKQHGHVFGDRVLQRVAEVLRDATDPELDFPARFGGDEFAVATIRRVSGAHDLATLLRDRIAGIHVEGLPAQTSVSIGLAGGRRLTSRPDAHPDATLDDLITRASTASTAAKKTEERIRSFDGGTEAGAVPLPRLTSGEIGPWQRVVVEGYRIGETGSSLEATVVLRAGAERHEWKVAAGKAELNRALATATARCLQLFARDRIRIEVDDTYEYTTPHGLPCVGATVTLYQDAEPPDCLVGTSPIRDDAHRSYINVVLDATNRRLSRLAD